MEGPHHENPIPRKYRGANLSDFKAADFQDEGWLIPLEGLQAHDMDVHTPGLAIFGKLGVGKTHLAAALVNWLNDQGTRAFRFTRWWLTTSLLYDLFNFPPEGRREIMTSLRGCGLLVLDDIGADKANEHSDAILLSVLEERIAADRVTIVTSNLSYTELKKRDERLWDRIRAFEKVILQGESRR